MVLIIINFDYFFVDSNWLDNVVCGWNEWCY